MPATDALTRLVINLLVVGKIWAKPKTPEESRDEWLDRMASEFQCHVERDEFASSQFFYEAICQVDWKAVVREMDALCVIGRKFQAKQQRPANTESSGRSG